MLAPRHPLDGAGSEPFVAHGMYRCALVPGTFLLRPCDRQFTHTPHTQCLAYAPCPAPPRTCCPPAPCCGCPTCRCGACWWSVLSSCCAPPWARRRWREGPHTLPGGKGGEGAAPPGRMSAAWGRTWVWARGTGMKGRRGSRMARSRRGRRGRWSRGLRWQVTPSRRPPLCGVSRSGLPGARCQSCLSRLSVLVCPGKGCVVHELRNRVPARPGPH